MTSGLCPASSRLSDKAITPLPLKPMGSLAPEMIRIGSSVGTSVAQTVEQALKAQAAGADYLGVGAVFATATKADASVLSRETLKEICRAVDVPVVAIGGINRDNLPELAGSGVDGVALVSAIFGAQDIEAACRSLRRLSEQMVNP